MAKSKNKWFSVRMAFEIRVAGKNRDWEARLVLFKATSEEEAFRKARAYGKKQNTRYKNAAGENVAWLFYDLVDYKKLDPGHLKDGGELWFELACRPMAWTSFLKKVHLAKPPRGTWPSRATFPGWVLKELKKLNGRSKKLSSKGPKQSTKN